VTDMATAWMSYSNYSHRPTLLQICACTRQRQSPSSSYCSWHCFS